MNKRILFVDDEANILSALRRMLRPMRDSWEMVFIDSGDKALEILKKSTVDVIVSDMKMPTMDGAAFLSACRKIQPEALRIILSGYADQESIIRTIGPAHQYLAKPCSSDELISSIKNAMELRDILTEPKLRQLVSKVEHLPTPPANFGELLQELNSEHGSAGKIAEIINHDIAMTAMVLKLTNSAFFSLAVPATSPLQAVRVLGFETIKTLILSGAIFSRLEPHKELSATFDTLCLRSQVIGQLSKEIALSHSVDKHMVEHAEIAGALSHLGIILELSEIPDQFQKIMSMTDREKCLVTTAEKHVLGATHSEIGGYLLGLWGFSHPIVEAVSFHHAPSDAPDQGISPLLFLHIAQELVRFSIDELENLPPTHTRLDLDYLGKLGVLGKFPDWISCAVKTKQGYEI